MPTISKMETPPLTHFVPAEFSCPCCGAWDMNHDFLSKLDRARKYARVPFRITSGFRCPRHNAEVGGKETSSHLRGYAADIAVTSSAVRFRVVRGLMEAGFTRIGIGKTFIHVDADPDKPDWVTWLYE